MRVRWSVRGDKWTNGEKREISLKLFLRNSDGGYIYYLLICGIVSMTRKIGKVLIDFFRIIFLMSVEEEINLE